MQEQHKIIYTEILVYRRERIKMVLGVGGFLENMHSTSTVSEVVGCCLHYRPFVHNCTACSCGTSKYIYCLEMHKLYSLLYMC